MMAESVASSPSRSGQPSLVGRDRELALLGERLGVALAGHGGLVLIGGEAGIGKTALAEALGREALDRGAGVVIGRCYDLTETPPYGPWREALAATPQSPKLPPLPAALDPTGQGEIVASQAALFTRAHAYLAVVASQRPLLLLLDDLHWADPASLDLLRHLARQLAALPLLLLATYRSDELTRRHPLYALLPALVREAHANRLDLRPLDAEATRTLVRSRYALPDADEGRLAAYLQDRAEGNPLYLGELLRTLEEEGLLGRRGDRWTLGDVAGARVPTLLRQVIDGRVARLGEEARRLLTAAAIIGQEVPFALWAAVAGADEAALLGPVEQAGEARLVTDLPDGGGVRFAHALIREALYEGAGALRRRALHRRIGEHLVAQPAPDPDAVAYHLCRAGDPRAAEWLVWAGERAWRAYAWLTAAERFEAALALMGQQGAEAGRRGWLTFRLATMRRYGDARGALGHAEEAQRLAGEAGDRLLAGAATFLRGMLLAGYLGELGRGIPAMEAGLAALDALPASERVPPGETAPLDPTLRRGTVVFQLSSVGRYAEALASGERYLAATPAPTAADWLGGNPYADAYHGLGLAYAALGQPDRARAALARAREQNRAVGHHVQARSSAMNELLVALAYQADRPDELRRLAARAEDAWRQTSGSVHAPSPERAVWLPLLVLEGRWAEARALAAQAQALSWMVGAQATLTLATLAREQGDPALAWALLLGWLPEGAQTAPGEERPLSVLPLQRLAAALALDAGGLAAARAWLEAHDHWLDWSGAVLGRAGGHLGWAAYHRAASDLAEARKHAEQGLRQAIEPRQPLALLAAHRLLGELDSEAGRHAEAQAHLTEALALADACAAPYERALTLLALAELRAATGQRDEARALWEEVRAICAPLDAKPILARADALAERLSAEPPAVSLAARGLPAGLTDREAEVLRLVAEGLSDAQVAERLYLSPYTVKAHLRSIYGKLGVPSRTAAARFASEHGLA